MEFLLWTKLNADAEKRDASCGRQRRYPEEGALKLPIERLDKELCRDL